MNEYRREQRFDMKILAVLVVLILVIGVIMLTVGRDLFWTAVG